jgi:hypothetical protein
MLLLIREGAMEEALLKENLDRVFQRRNTHSLPNVLPLPPDDWKAKFDLLAKECGMNESLDQAVTAVRKFYQGTIRLYQTQEINT